MLLLWLDAALGQTSKLPLDEYRPEISQPETAQDWITNIGWLKDWTASVFTNVLKLDADLTKRSEPASLDGKDWQIWRMRLGFEEARVRSFVLLQPNLTPLLPVLQHADTVSRLSRRDSRWPPLMA